LLQFSGTVFYARGDGTLQVMLIPWDKEVRFKLPLKTWKELMDPTTPTRMALPTARRFRTVASL
jgi:hypothetical protein